MRAVRMLGCVTIASSAFAQSPLVDLRQHWSETNQDFVLTSDPNFAGNNPGYVAVRYEGKAFAPAATRPRDTVELHTWWSPSRQDFHTSAEPAWYGGPGSQNQGYTWVRNEGYAYRDPVAGTWELQRFYDGTRADSWSTTDPKYTATPKAGYAVREVLGYVLPSPRDPNAPADSLAFHYGTMTPTGLRPRPLVVLMLDYSDSSFDTRVRKSEVDRMYFGTGYPSLQEYTAENSFGLFRWTRAGAGVYGPFRLADDPLTSADESSYWTSRIPTNPAHPTSILHFGMETRGFNWVSAVGGGGATVVATATSRSSPNLSSPDSDAGDDGNLTIIDLTPPLGPISDQDIVAIRTFDGHYLGRTASNQIDASGTSIGSAQRFRIRDVNGTGIVEQGDRFTLQSMQNGRYVAAIGGGGSGLSVVGTFPGNDGIFRLWRQEVRLNAYIPELLGRAVAGGLDLKRYDANANGAIEKDELDLVLFSADPTDGFYRAGTNRNVSSDNVPGTGLRVGTFPDRLLPIANNGQAASFATLAHELVHSLGTFDIYGPDSFSVTPVPSHYSTGGCRSMFASLMSCTAWPIDFDRRSLHVDPWHRMRLGWAFPRLVDLTDPGGSLALRATAAATGPLDRAAWPVILYDPARYDLGTRQGEFFTIEYRTSEVGNYDVDYATASSTRSGVAIWLVQTDAIGRLSIVRVTKNPDPVIQQRWLLHVGAPSGTLGIRTPWMSTNGLIQPRWSDGTPAAFRLRVAPHTDRDPLLFVDWSQTGTLRPRLDFVDKSKASPGDVVTIYGELPTTPAGAQVQLQTSGTPFLGSIVAWDAESVSFRVPGARASSPPPGKYPLLVDVGGAQSNALELEVLPYSGIVSPVQVETIEAPSRSSLPFAPATSPLRYQQAHGDLRGNPRTISRIQFRRDGLVAAAGGQRVVELEVWMGHTDFDTFSSSYTQNFRGGSPQVIARKTITLPDLGDKPVTGPAPFLVTLPLDTPFAYNGVDDLLWEVVVHAAPSGTYRLDGVSVGHAEDHGVNLGGGCVATGQSRPMGLNGTFRDDGGYLRMEFNIERGPAGTAGVLNLDLTDPALVLPGLCGTMHTTATISLPMPNTNFAGFSRNGVHTFVNNPAWAGVPMFAQALYLDAGQTFGVALSDGRKLTIPAAHTRRDWRVARCYGGTGKPDFIEWGDGLVVRFD